MTDSDDIANLFKHFGGQPDQYREIARSNDARLSRARWPLLTAVEATQASDAPPVQQHLRASPQAERAPATPPAAPQAAARQEPVLRSEPSPFLRAAAAPSMPQAAPQRDVAAPAALHAASSPLQAVPAAPPAPGGPGAEFIPPRPRAPARFEPRPPADVAMPFGRMVPEAAGTAAQPAMAASPTSPAGHGATASAPFAASPAAHTAAAPASFSTAASASASPLPAIAPPAPAGLPAQSALAAAPATELQTMFARLAQPAPDTPPTPDKNASLLQRLRRL